MPDVALESAVTCQPRVAHRDGERAPHRRAAGATVRRLMVVCALVLTGRRVPALGQALTLRQVLARVVSSNPQLAEARFAVDASDHSVTSAWARRLPRVSTEANFTRREDPLPYIPAPSPSIPAHFSNAFASWSGVLTVPLYQGGQLATNVALANVRRDLQVLSLAQTRNDLLANTVNAYNKLLQLRRLREAIRASTAALEEQVRNARVLLAVERIARVDLLKAEVQLANERQRLLALDEGVSTASAALAYLMGNAPSADTAEIVLADSLTMPDSPDLLGADERQEWTQRPEYRAAVAAVRAARLTQRSTLGKLLPSVSGVGGYTRQFGFRPDYADGNWFVGLQASLPLLDGALVADATRDQALRRQAEERLHAVENRLALELTNARTAMRESGHRVTTARQVIGQARESFRIEQLKYDSGAGTMSDLLLAQSAGATAEANLTQALFDYNAALVAYHTATGTMEEYLR